MRLSRRPDDDRLMETLQCLVTAIFEVWVFSAKVRHQHKCRSKQVPHISPSTCEKFPKSSSTQSFEIQMSTFKTPQQTNVVPAKLHSPRLEQVSSLNEPISIHNTTYGKCPTRRTSSLLTRGKPGPAVIQSHAVLARLGSVV